MLSGQVAAANSVESQCMPEIRIDSSAFRAEPRGRFFIERVGLLTLRLGSMPHYHTDFNAKSTFGAKPETLKEKNERGTVVSPERQERIS